jgi:hypothetical protein
MLYASQLIIFVASGHLVHTWCHVGALSAFLHCILPAQAASVTHCDGSMLTFALQHVDVL